MMMTGKFVQHTVLWGLILLALAGCGDDSTAPEEHGDPPTVEITAPVNGGTVSLGVTVTAVATNATRVHFYVDSVEFATVEDAPFSTIWNSGGVANGAHILRVRAVGSDQVVDAEISVNVVNTAGAVIVTVNPPSATVEVGESLQLSAVVSGAANNQVNWTVDQGATAGTVTSSGLYTAPVTLPSPSMATIRATSVGNPPVSSTAVVTLTSGGGASGDENWVSQLAFGAGGEAVDESFARLEMTAQVVWHVAGLNGGNLTLHGTLTQVTQGTDDYTYSPTPADRLVLSNIGYQPISMEFTAFDGYFGDTWEDFIRSHLVDITVSQPGWGELRIQSQTNVAKDAAWSWQRTYTGSLVYEGKTVVVDIHNEGSKEAVFGHSFASYETRHATTGTAVSDGVSVTIRESYWATLMHSGGTAQQSRNFKIRSGSSATFEGNTYQFTGSSDGMAWVEWETFTQLTGGGDPDPSYHNMISQADYWRCNGSLSKNSELIGVVVFNGPVVEETWGPDLVLNYVVGGSVLLHTLIDMP